MGTGAARDFTSSGARASALAELAPTNLSIQVDLAVAITENHCKEGLEDYC